MRYIESPERQMSQELEKTGFSNEAIQRSLNAVKPKNQTQGKHWLISHLVYAFAGQMTLSSKALCLF